MTDIDDQPVYDVGLVELLDAAVDDNRVTESDRPPWLARIAAATEDGELAMWGVRNDLLRLPRLSPSGWAS